MKHAPRDCNLGCLQSIMLPPYCISIPRTDVPMETIIGVQNRFNWAAASSSSSPFMQQAGFLGSSGGGGGQSNSSLMNAASSHSSAANLASKRDNLSPRSTSEDFCQTNLYYQLQEESRDRDEEIVKVYDGNSSLKKRSFRLISVPKLIGRDQLIAACLRAFYIHDDVSHYALIDITEGSGERELRADEPYPIVSLINGVSSAPLYGSNAAAIQSAASLAISAGTNQPGGGGGGSTGGTGSKRENKQAMMMKQQQQLMLQQQQQLQHQHQHQHSHQLQQPPALLLRYRPPDSFMGTIRIYPGRLNVTDLTYSSVMVTSDTSVDDVMKQALDKFRLKSNDLNRYRLVEVSLDKGSSVHERTMDNQECPWEIIKNVARESVRQKENTRFYLQQQDEVYCSSVAIFVGNLPANLSQKQYESMLMEHLGKPYRFKSINPIYYEYGSCIITYDNADIAVKAFYMLRESTIRQSSSSTGGGGEEGKGLVVLLLPNIVPEMIPEGVRVSSSSTLFSSTVS